MRVFIEYVIRGEKGTWNIETTFSWGAILDYKLAHPDVTNDEAAIEGLAQKFLEEQFGTSVSLIGVHRA